MLNILHNKTAYEVINYVWIEIYGFISYMAVGGRLGNFQKSLPSFVFASSGYVYNSCLISFL